MPLNTGSNLRIGPLTRKTLLIEELAHDGPDADYAAEWWQGHCAFCLARPTSTVEYEDQNGEGYWNVCDEHAQTAFLIRDIRFPGARPRV